MKKFTVLALCLVMVLSLAACGKTEDDGSETPTLDPVFKREEGANIITGYKPGDVKLGQYTGLTYTPMSTEVSDEEVQTELDSFVSSYKSKIEVTDRNVVQFGDVVAIDYKGFKAGETEPFSGGTGSSEALWIGSGTFIPGFEDALIGHEKGTTFTINVTFPEDYPNSEMAGVEANFEVTVNSISIYRFPELTDAFIAEKTSNKYETIEAYKENIRNQKKSEKQSEAEVQKENDLAQLAIDNATFNIDLTEEIKKALANLKNNLDSMYINSFGVDGAGYYYLAYGMSSEQYAEHLQKMTEFSVKYEYVRSAIVEAERFEVTDAEIDTLASNLMAQYGYTSLNDLYDAIKSQNGVEGREFLTEQVKLNKASDLIFSTAIPK